MSGRYLGPIVVVAGGVALAAIILATGPSLDKQAPTPRVPAVQVAQVSPRTVQMTVTAHGEVLPKTESDLVSEVAGRVVAVAPTLVSGGFFTRGDVLVEIERVDYEVALEQSRAQLASAMSELENAEKAFRRREELAETQSVSASIGDDARNRLTIAEASLRAARALIARAERDLERTRMTAPYDGRVRAERVDAGQFVNRGEAIARLYSIDYAEVRLPVRDVDLAFLPLSLARKSASATAMPRVVLRAEFAGAEHTWQARIVRTEGELDPRTRMINMIAQVPRPYEPSGSAPALTVGLFVEAEIFGNRVDDVIVVPRTAVQQGNRLYVVTPDNRLAFRDATILRMTGATAYIKAGVQAGEAICLSALDAAVEGQSVLPITAAASS